MLSTDTLLNQIRTHSECNAREATDRDAFDGVRPRVVVEPFSADAMAETLRWASSEQLQVQVTGGRSKQMWGAPSGPVDVLISTSGLNRVIAHRHGDLTATVEAGVTLASLNSALASHGQWLPWDPPWANSATIGGIVATNDSGPRRHGFGAPRDSIIGVTLARIDGCLAKAGGIVVKNVAGYDLSRLMTGSFGCLGVIVTATFKLAPKAAASRTVIVNLDSFGTAVPVVADLAASSLTPTALELMADECEVRVLVRFESVEDSCARQAEQAIEVVGRRGTCRAILETEETEIWRQHMGHWDLPGTLIKLSCLPSELIAMLDWVRETSSKEDLRFAVAGRVGLGVADIRLEGPVDSQARLILTLREKLRVGRGSAVLRSADLTLRQKVDVWGPVGSGITVMRAVKNRFDSANRLNAFRGPAGL